MVAESRGLLCQRRKNMKSLKELNPKAAAIIDRGIYSHKVWKEYLEKDPNYPTNDVGAIETHEQWIKDYEYLEQELMKTYQ